MDIVERLRSWSHAQSNHPQLLREAADEIARLQSDNARLDATNAILENEVLRLRSTLECLAYDHKALRADVAGLQSDNARLLAFIRGCSVCREEYEEQSRRDRDAQDARAALAPPPQR